MRKIEVKHPEYGRFGILEKYADRALIHSEPLVNRIDFYPNRLPKIDPQSKQPTLKDKEEVTKKSLEVLSKIFVDGKPLTDLYDFELNISSFNPSGFGAANWRYYLVGMKKKSLPLKEATKFPVKVLSGKSVKADAHHNIVNNTNQELNVSIEDYDGKMTITIN